MRGVRGGGVFAVCQVGDGGCGCYNAGQAISIEDTWLRGFSTPPSVYKDFGRVILV